MTLADLDFSSSTALVTGGSSGIGHAIAEELVARGVRRLVLVGRDQDKLSKVAGEIEASAANLSIRTIKADLTTHEGPQNIQKEVDGWDWTIDILVNNAGFARKYVFGKDTANDSSLANIDLLVRSLVDMSLRFLPGMVERRKGGILNLGSTAGHQPVPYTAVYAASKAFVISFSQSVREENLHQDTGVRIACIVPGVTSTNLTGEGTGEQRGAIDKVGIDKPSDVAKAAVKAFEENAAARVVGWNNAIFQTAVTMLPQSLVANVVARVRGAPGDE
ncbi:NAD(P)-binding protein [Aureobasidium subglaciale]|nr:NAD(P)-binding protein [Aureobasidium subglaciale]